jgi:AraC family transcriptional activator of tynA and feaB
MIAWTTAALPRADRYDAWDGRLASTYCGFSLDRPFSADFEARVHSRNADSLSVIDCVCDPFSARRGRAHLERDGREVFGIQLVLSGREEISIGDERVLLEPGDILLWDNTRPMSLCVRERLHKISVMTPLSRLRQWLPNSWGRIQHKIAGGSNAANLLSAHLRSLHSFFIDDDLGSGDALLEASLGLVIDANHRLSTRAPDSVRGAQLVRVKRYIDCNLSQSELSPAMIAAANRFSVRYLHWLFKPTGESVSQYVIRQRLQRCRRDLSTKMMRGRTITDIALSWGFRDPTHFSRRFRQEFGVSAHEYRRQACGVLAN